MLTLRHDQAEVLEEIERRLSAGSRALLLQAPTGWGKTVLFSSLSSQRVAAGQRVCIVVHRIELLGQVSRTLTALGVEHGCIAPSYPTTARPVQVASVLSLARRLPNYQAPDLLIIDEAHHAITSTTWGRVIAAWRDTPRLGVTATPERLSGEGLRETFAEMLTGPSVSALIAHGHLSPYRLYAPPHHATDAVHTRMGDFAKGELAEAMDTPTITGDAVAHYQRLGHGKRALAFCVSVQHAEHVAEQFRQAGYAAMAIDGTLSPTVRQERIEAFREHRLHVLTSCELVSEGFDLPAIEVAILLRPTQSLALYLQQVGRALRPFPGKASALILDHAGNALRHGLPDDERVWSLDGRERKPAASGETAPACRTCGGCFAAVRAGVTICPYCQWVFPIKSREVEEVDGELQPVTRSADMPIVCRSCGRTRPHILFNSYRRSEGVLCSKCLSKKQEVGQARDLQALLKIQHERGYKHGWAYYVYRARQLKMGRSEKQIQSDALTLSAGG